MFIATRLNASSLFSDGYSAAFTVFVLTYFYCKQKPDFNMSGLL
jgi:hypothetical protein